MMKNKIAISVIISVIFAGMLAPDTSAQSMDVVEAFVDRDLIYLDEQLTLTVVVNTEGGQAPLPELPPLGAFTIVGSSTGSQISIINGQMSTQAYYQYTLQARQIGEYVIDPIKVTLDGNTYNSIPIKIQVEAGASQTSPRRKTTRASNAAYPIVTSNDSGAASRTGHVAAITATTAPARKIARISTAGGTWRTNLPERMVLRI